MTMTITHIRFALCALALVFESVQIGSELFRGGVRNHFLWMDASLPLVSNWWGLVLLPALAWWLGGAALKRPGFARHWPWAVVAFVASVVYGSLFIRGFDEHGGGLLALLLLGLPVAGILLPVYRGEYVLGLLFGLSWYFGVVVPGALVAVVALGSALLHRGVYRLFRRRPPQTPPRSDESSPD